MINSPKKFFYLLLTINILLMAGVVLLVWQIKEKKAELVKTIPSTSSVKLPSEELLSGLNNYFLSASTTVEFLERLENTAKLTKTSFKINQAEVKDNLRLNFSVQGSFPAVNQFLTLLEKFPYALRIERLNWQVGNNGVWKSDFVITIMTQSN